MIKIKLECWWADSNSINSRLIKQFVSDEDLLKYSFVNESPDFTVVFGRTDWNKIETPKERTFYISQEPLWSPNQPKDNIHNYCSKILISDKADYPNRDEYIETLLPMFYAGRGENDNREMWDWSLKLKDREFNKNKIMSMIVRKGYESHFNHLVNPDTSEINYGRRTELGETLSLNNNIDIFGTHWENNGGNIKGEVWNKHVGLDEYKFSICCENTIQKNYISEKFWDAVLTETIPIYLGCSNINEYISSDCYINITNLTFEQTVEKINDIIDNSDDYYNRYVQNIKNLKQDFFKNSNFNVWEKIKKLIKDYE
jgi:hypothetical protein